MIVSPRRAPRTGACITVAALLVALAASVSPLVPAASAVDPTPDPGAAPSMTPGPAPDPTVTVDPVPVPISTPDSPAPMDPAPAPPDPTPTPNPTPVPAPAPSASDAGPSGSPAIPPDQIPLYALVLPSSDAVMTLAGPLGPSSFTSPHTAYTLTTDACGTCHRAHTGQNTMLLSEPPPQAGLCFTCHDGSGSVLNTQSDFPGSPANDPTTSSYYAHPATVDLTHAPGLTDEFGGRLERHATCADCHDPHNADGTLTTANAAGWSASGAIIGASGVTVANGAAGTAPTYALVRNVSFEYQLCFKCHSGFTVLPAQDPAHPSRWALDKGVELNPANGSYHPIEAPGTNATAAMAASLAGGTLWQFGTGDTVRCVNCHSDPSRRAADPGARLAPHASTERGILIAPYRDRLLKPTGQAYQGTDFTLCFLCHAAEPFTNASSTATNFELHAKHLTSIDGIGSGGTDIDVGGGGQGNAICAECHFRLHSTALAVKPGDVNNTRLVNFAPNVLPNGGVLTWAAGPSGSCTLTCHGVAHGSEGYGRPLAIANSTTMAGTQISVVPPDTR